MLLSSFDVQRSLRCAEEFQEDSTFEPGDVYGVRNDSPDLVGSCERSKPIVAMSDPPKGERYQILICSRFS
jgi:hypothetical protein